MKLRLFAFFIIGTFVFSSCVKKQCPAYGQVEHSSEVEVVSV
ncbi:hypothetical protein [Arcticibacterium luteifluviistationis]|nr:hypothetical protein [Arcticibacterium luteifluviistationis]